jgi:hypothetical protein
MTGILPFRMGQFRVRWVHARGMRPGTTTPGTVIWLPTAGADEAGLRQSGVMSVSGVCQAEDRERPGRVAAGLS